MEIDATDRRIVSLLEEDGRRPVVDIAEHVGLSPAAIHGRLDDLEDAGIIKGYDAIVDPEALGVDGHAIIRLRIEQGRVTEAKEQLRELDGVQSIRLLAGSWDVVVRVYASNITVLEEVLFEEVKQMTGIARAEMDVILNTEYRDHGLPVDAYLDEGEGTESVGAD